MAKNVIVENGKATSKGLRLVDFNGETYGLIEEIDIDFEDMTAGAAAVKIGDDPKRHYIVEWEVHKDFVYKDDNDFSDACDWDNPTDVWCMNDWGYRGVRIC